MCASAPSLLTAQGLTLSDLRPLPVPEAGALVIVPGYRSRRPSVPAELRHFLREAASAGAQVCSVCTGAFLLGEASLLDGRECTTHWKRVDELQQRFPRARVLRDRLFVRDGNLITSAGIASGIDMALALVEEDHGPALTARVARELVVYLRRDAGHVQQSVYLDYRTHLDSGVHELQDHLVAHPETRDTLAQLAQVARTSPRSLTRRFREATGLSILAFRTRVRLERANTLLNAPGLTIEAVASRCGFSDARQLRRLWKAAYGKSPRQRSPTSS